MRKSFNGLMGVSQSLAGRSQRDNFLCLSMSANQFFTLRISYCIWCKRLEQANLIAQPLIKKNRNRLVVTTLVLEGIEVKKIKQYKVFRVNSAA